MPTRRLRPSLACVLWCLLAGCQGPTPVPPAADYTLVLLKTGARTELLAKEAQATVFAGHFANMERLARAGHLLVAGPYGTTKSDPARRGLFVLDTGDPAAARALAETDPGFQAGVFQFEYHALATAAPLRAHLAAELAALAAAEQAGRKPAPGEGGRMYALLTATDGERARAALAGRPGVLLLAQLDGRQAWALLDAVDLAAAKALLEPVAAQLGPHTLEDWFGSGGLAQLPGR